MKSALLALFVCSVTAFAQTPLGTVTGLATDASGGAVPGVSMRCSPISRPASKKPPAPTIAALIPSSTCRLDLISSPERPRVSAGSRRSGGLSPVEENWDLRGVAGRGQAARRPGRGEGEAVAGDAGQARGFDVLADHPLPPNSSWAERAASTAPRVNIQTQVNTMERGRLRPSGGTEAGIH